MTGNNPYHQAVLLSEAVEALNIMPNGIYVDATFGGGSHSRAILAALQEGGKLFAFDQDEDAQQNIPAHDARFVFVAQNFKHLKRFLRLHGVSRVNGILADLGVSWHQFNTPGRGFSIRFNSEQLDMRMSTEVTQTAGEIINRYSVAQLTEMFGNYGDLPNARKIAEAIAAARQKHPIETVQQLKGITAPFAIGKLPQFYARVFQAVRMEVNREEEALEQLLQQSAQVLEKGGRLVVIAYHSVEDRMVKNFIKTGNTTGLEEKDIFGNSEKPFKAVNKKVITPSQTEIKENPKAASAKMRIAEKL